MDLQDCRDQVYALEETVDRLQNKLGALRSIPLHYGEIKSGKFPLSPEEGIYQYAVQVNGNTVAMVVHIDKDSEFGFDDYQIGTKILILDNGSILRPVPEELIVLKKKDLELDSFSAIEWKDIGGLSEQIDTIRDAVETPIIHRKIYEDYGISPLKGVLLYGPPGCGKTLIAKAIATFVLGKKKRDPDSFIYIKGPEHLGMWVGSTEEKIRSMFKRARNHFETTGQRSVIFLDEADALLPARGTRRSSDIDKTIVPTFLSEMDGFENNGPFMILASNLPETMDGAVIREGRIDLHIPILRPSREGFREIFEIHASKVRLAEPIEEFSLYATERVFESETLSDRVSGALAESIIKKATANAIKRDISSGCKYPSGVNLVDLQESIPAQ